MNMSSPCKKIVIIYTLLVLAGAVCVSGWWASAFLADLFLTFLLLKRKSLISYSFSLIPAIMVWMVCLGRSPLWGYVSAALTIALVLIYRGRLPETRQTTDLWMGTLLLTAISCVTPFIVAGCQ